MNGNSILKVNLQLLKNVDNTKSVLLFKALLYAEARAKGYPLPAIHISTRTNTPDGGIDASIDEVEGYHPHELDLIYTGRTGYQIKSGSSFSPTSDSEIKKELFGDGKLVAIENLGAGIKEVLDVGGRYYLVNFASETVETQRNQCIALIKKYLNQVGYQNPSVHFIDAKELSLLIEQYPSLVARLNGRTDDNFVTHETWYDEAEMRRKLVLDDVQKALKETISNEIRSGTSSNHIRITGDPGVGKTRLICEATSPDDIEPLVLYFDSATKFLASTILKELRNSDSTLTAVLVIDECSETQFQLINNWLSNNQRIRIVSIHSEEDSSRGEVKRFHAPAWNEVDIAKIIEYYTADPHSSQRYAELCSGSPRIAHLLGENLKANSANLLQALTTIDVFNRYIEGHDSPDNIEVQERKKILRYVSLFKRFGFGGGHIAEAQSIFELMKTNNPTLSWDSFQETVKKLKRRKILQGDTTLYITPKALHINLWLEWWDTYGVSGFDHTAFIANLSPAMKQCYYDMFIYARESEVASERVETILGMLGPFANGDLLDDPEGSRFFLALSEARPDAALKLLQSTVGLWDIDKLKAFKEGRRNIVWALEKIVVWEELFDGAARLLLKLALAENEKYSNNASGVFTGLFSIQPSNTAAPPQARFSLLKECVTSEDHDVKMLALDACDTALGSHSYRVIGPEFQGLRTAKLWNPKTLGEYIGAHTVVWTLLNETLPTLQGDEKNECARVILGNCRRVIQFKLMQKMVLDDLNNWIETGIIDVKELVELVESLLHYDAKEFGEEVIHQLHQIQKKLTTDDYPSQMQRYVSMDLLEDKFDENKKHIDKTKGPIKKLVRQSLEQPNAFYNELNWLLSGEAKKGFDFGYALGKADTKNILLKRIIAEFQSRLDQKVETNDFFLGGYLRALAEKDTKQWDVLMDRLVLVDSIIQWVPSLIWRCHVTDKSLQRVLDLAIAGKVTPAHLKIFGWGSVLKDISEDFFQRWMDFLLKEGSFKALSVALDHYQFYYLDKHKQLQVKLPKQLTLDVLLHPTHFTNDESKQRDSMDDYAWQQIATTFIKQYPLDCDGLLRVTVEKFREDGTILEGYKSEAAEILNLLVKNDSHKTWNVIKDYLGPPIDGRAYHLSQWLRGDSMFEKNASGPLEYFGLEDIWQWVEEDIEKRAWYLASFVPKELHHDEGKVCWVREVLARYGERGDVRENLSANFSSEGWSGPTSIHLQKKKEQLLTFKKGEDNTFVKQWVDEYVAHLDSRIKKEKVDEEREW